MKAATIDSLRATALFRDLDEPALVALAARSVERRLARGEILFVGGSEATGLYVVVEGELRAFRENIDGREQVIHVERAGSTIAEVPVFDGGPYPSTVAANVDSIVLFLDKRDVKRLILEHPHIGLSALSLLAKRLRATSDLVESLALRDVGQRIARVLLAESKVRGKRTVDGVVVTLGMTNSELAARVGSVREVVSRSFTRMQTEGCIAVKGRSITILDEERLAELASDD